MRSKFTRSIIAFIIMLASFSSFAQTTAMDFTRTACGTSTSHNLYADLNSGKVVIMEFIMLSCSPCVVAGNALETIKANILTQFPGKIKTYAFGFSNTYSCSSITNWVQSNGFTSIPCDSGAAQVAYYGGMGMPTIVIAAGNDHHLLGSPYLGFTITDTTAMAANIRAYLNNPNGIKENKDIVSALNIYPNPANTEFQLSLQTKEAIDLTISILDVAGKTVLTVPQEKIQKGAIVRTINTSNLANGNYIIRINSNGTISNQKLVIVH